LKSFGELLRDFRHGQRMTQQEMADRLSLSSPYIAQMESGFKPPPPEAIVEKIAKLLHLDSDQKHQLMDAAESEREIQSLVKATRKVGYVLAKNKVCVPQKSISFRTQYEVDELVTVIPKEVPFYVDIVDGVGISRNNPESLAGLKSHDDLRSWALSELGDQPAVWLTFLGELYDILLLTPDGSLLCRQPSRRRQELFKLGREVGTFFERFRELIRDAINHAADQDLPEVIAPHVAWKDIDDMLGAGSPSPTYTGLRGNREDGSIRDIPIVGIIKPNTEDIQEESKKEFIGLPQNWFNPEQTYEACSVQSDAYVSIGVWPGCRAIYELNGKVDNEDLVLVRLGDRKYLRRYFDLGEQILLQGGPLARPIQVSKTESSVQVLGVIRELVSMFKDMR